MNTRRQITPHKGGRTARLEIRIKPEVREKLRQIAQPGESSADTLERLIEREFIKVKSIV